MLKMYFSPMRPSVGIPAIRRTRILWGTAREEARVSRQQDAAAKELQRGAAVRMGRIVRRYYAPFAREQSSIASRGSDVVGTPRVHTYRTSGGHRDHRHSDRPVASGRSEGTRGRQSREVPE